jgi:murein DD-endopeptidase MepM/ murein hydrolase activator NlpD
VTEGNQVTFTVTRNGDKPSETVYFSTLSSGTATYSAGDFTTTSGGQPLNIPVSFGSGVTSQTVTLNIVNDGVNDSGEQFRAIVQRNNTDAASTFLDRSSFVTINDPAQTSYSLTPSMTSVNEGNQVTFTVTRTGNKPAETVYFSTLSDGTATFGQGDYATTSGGRPLNIAVNFASSDTSNVVTLNILNDGISDSGEQFRAIVQRNSTDAVSTFLDRSGFVTINEAVQPTSYSLTPSATTMMEGSQASFTITRMGDKPAETVYFSTLSDGTASFEEGDYATVSGGRPLNIAVNFANGEAAKTVALNIVNDGVNDYGETFRAIVQRNSSDPASTFLGRSEFVTIGESSHTANPSDTNPLVKIFSVLAEVAHAEELNFPSKLYLPFEAGQVAGISQRPGGGTSHNKGTATTAIDFGIPLTTEVRAMAAGTIVFVEKGHSNYTSFPTVNDDDHLTPKDPNYDLGPGKLGNFVTVKHSIMINGEVREFYATYAHLDPELASRFKSSGEQPVSAGTTLGKVGITGATFGPHVHVQVGWQPSSTMDGRGIVADGASSSDRGEDSTDLMSYLRFAENDVTWNSIAGSVISQNDPATIGEVVHGNGDSNLVQEFVAKVHDLFDNVIKISASSTNAIVAVEQAAKNFVLDHLDEIRIIGGAAIDKLDIGSLFGSSIKNNTVYFDGGAGNDEMNGSATDRHIVAEGGTGNDTLIGGFADDIFTGGPGGDGINGGAGTNTAVYSGAHYEYLIARPSPGAFQITDLRAGSPDGSDTVFNVQNFQFADQTSAITLLAQHIFQLSSFAPGAGGWTSQHEYPRQIADVDGDGMADIVGFGAGGVTISLATGSGHFGTPTGAIGNFGTAAGGWSSQDLYPRLMADVNGDKMADIVAFGAGGVTVSLATGNGHFAAPTGELGNFGAAAGGWSSEDKYPRLMADVNGDKMADIVAFGAGGVTVSLATGNGHFAAPTGELGTFGAAAGGWSSQDKYPRLLADVNGDKMADIVAFGAGGVTVSLATGNGHFGAPTGELGTFGAAAGGWSSEDLYPRLLADVNGDGKADILGFGAGGVTVSFATGNGHFGTPTGELGSFGAAAGGWSSQDLYPRALGDVNGDGVTDIVGFAQTGVFDAIANGFHLI